MTSKPLVADADVPRQGGPDRSITDVAVGVLIRPDGGFLLTSRPPGKAYAGYWEFPGGKLEAGESVHQALCRELREELGIDVDAATKPFHEKLGIQTRIGRFEDDTTPGQFDVIQIAHAIYFITDPMGFLARVRAKLVPGGAFLVIISDFLASTDNGKPSYAHTFYPCAASMQRGNQTSRMPDFNCVAASFDKRL